MSETVNTRIISASAETIYHALTDPQSILKWQAPGEMTTEIHDYELRVGGGYSMSLYYPATETMMKGKTAAREDRFTARFTELVPNEKVVEAIRFDTSDPSFAGEMTMEILLRPAGTGTRVTFTFKNIPVGIRPEDNEKGTLSSLEKLAALVE